MSSSATQTKRLARMLMLSAMLILGGFALTGGAVNAQGDDSPWTSQSQQDSASVVTDIVVGRVVSILDVETPTTVHTVATIAVSERELGDAADEIKVEIPGGTFSDGSRLLVSHQPSFHLESTVRLELVLATPEERAALAVDAYSIVGAEKGFQLVDSGPYITADAAADYTFTNERLSSFPTGFGLVPNPPEAVAIDLIAAALEWDIATCSTIEVDYLGELDFDPLNNNDGVNMVGPSVNLSPADTFLAAAQTRVSATNEILEWDIVFNTRDHLFDIDAFTPGSFDWRTVQRHEIGHVLGLGHSVSQGTSAISEVMYDKIPPNVLKSLGLGDRTGATLLYPAHPFNDVQPLSYYERAVVWLNNSAITNGTSTTTYSPFLNVTRADMATFLHRLAGSPAVSGTTPFVDVPASGVYYSTPVLWLYQTGITAGISPTTFGPTDTVTRAQMATFLHRYAGSPAVTGAHPFADVPGGDWYSVPVNWLYQTGITAGISPTLFGPTDTVTRAQMAAFLHRFAGQPEAC